MRLWNKIEEATKLSIEFGVSYEEAIYRLKYLEAFEVRAVQAEAVVRESMDGLDAFSKKLKEIDEPCCSRRMREALGACRVIARKHGIGFANPPKETKKRKPRRPPPGERFYKEIEENLGIGGALGLEVR